MRKNTHQMKKLSVTIYIYLLSLLSMSTINTKTYIYNHSDAVVMVRKATHVHGG